MPRPKKTADNPGKMGNRKVQNTQLIDSVAINFPDEIIEKNKRKRGRTPLNIKVIPVSDKNNTSNDSKLVSVSESEIARIGFVFTSNTIDMIADLSAYYNVRKRMLIDHLYRILLLNSDKIDEFFKWSESYRKSGLQATAHQNFKQDSHRINSIYISTLEVRDRINALILKLKYSDSAKFTRDLVLFFHEQIEKKDDRVLKELKTLLANNNYSIIDINYVVGEIHIRIRP